MDGRQVTNQVAVKMASRMRLIMIGYLPTLYRTLATMAAVNTRCKWVTIPRDTRAELGRPVTQARYRPGLPYRIPHRQGRLVDRPRRSPPNNSSAGFATTPPPEITLVF